MKEVIYLVVSPHKVERMTKKLPDTGRNEIPVKINLTVESKAFREPVLEQNILIEDWPQGTDLADVEFRGNVITEEEAKVIRARRYEKMVEVLRDQGYEITEPPTEES